VDFAESLGQHVLKAAHGVLHAAGFAGIGDHLLRLGCERRGEKVGVQVAHRTLEPDVKKVRQIAVGHVVIVRRVGEHGVKIVVWPRKLRGRALPDLGRGFHRWDAGEVGEDLEDLPEHALKRPR